MDNLQRALNEYLFHECAVEGDESLISETWPFDLRQVGQAPGLTVFEFHDDRPYFAIAGRSLNFMPKAGMTFEDLLLQDSGSSWIGTRDPVDLSTSMPGDASVPFSFERRQALEALGAHALGAAEVQILEGLFLRSERRYVGLFRLPGADEAFVAGLSVTPTPVTFSEASAWRRLAWGVGAWLQRGA
jgi:hypothetical protein